MDSLTYRVSARACEPAVRCSEPRALPQTSSEKPNIRRSFRRRVGGWRRKRTERECVFLPESQSLGCRLACAETCARVSFLLEDAQGATHEVGQRRGLRSSDWLIPDGTALWGGTGPIRARYMRRGPVSPPTLADSLRFAIFASFRGLRTGPLRD